MLILGKVGDGTPNKRAADRSLFEDVPDPDFGKVMTLPQSGRLDGGEQPQGLPDVRAQRL
jgi:hypothetical protein